MLQSMGGVTKSQTWLSEWTTKILWAKLLPSCPTVSNPLDCSPPGSSVHGIFLAIILEWVAMPSSRWSFQLSDRTYISHLACIGRRVLYHLSKTAWEALAYWEKSKGYLHLSLTQNFQWPLLLTKIKPKYLIMAWKTLLPPTQPLTHCFSPIKSVLATPAHLWFSLNTSWSTRRKRREGANRRKQKKRVCQIEEVLSRAKKYLFFFFFLMLW